MELEPEKIKKMIENQKREILGMPGEMTNTVRVLLKFKNNDHRFLKPDMRS